ncbi:MAG TPA: hypothetical protein VF855_14080 [Acidimicrobiales bacterium]
MSNSVEEFVHRFVAETAGRAWELDRRVDERSGLDAAGMIEALNHPALGRLGIPVMADFMAPEGSLYFDAIFGGFRGQAAIRAWLLPAMAEIEFVDFVPTAEPVLFDDGDGGTSLDEWEMVANLGDVRIPLSRGVSVRRYRDGWITWACDVYDTGVMRQPPPPEAGIDAAPLPPWPRESWPLFEGWTAAPPSAAARDWLDARGARNETAVTEPCGLDHHEMHAVLDASAGRRGGVLADLAHPTRAVHIDPLVGELHGRAAIRTWLAEREAKGGEVTYAPLGPSLFDGTTSVQEWLQLAGVPGGPPVPTLRGTTVRRYEDGWLVSNADYFDTAPLSDTDIQAALSAAGAMLTPEDIARHRP